MSEQNGTRTYCRYIDYRQQALLKVLDALGERPLDALTVEGLAGDLRLARGMVLRTLETAEKAGWVEQAPQGRWRLTPRVTRMSERLRLAMAESAAERTPTELEVSYDETERRRGAGRRAP